ncbi:alginate export family protein [Neptunomonas sp.]|uniref:alginate export family protein n=1 Tax=Neptunomonas sp. TaxID=1971898 RepID=UPI0035693973
MMIQKRIIVGLVASAMAATAQSAVLSSSDETQIELNVEAMAGVFSTSEDYVGESGRTWQEGYVKPTFVISHKLPSGIQGYAGLGAIALGTAGDGDAAGLTNGDEGEFDLENAYLGVRSSNNLIDLSVGQQTFQLGDGFLIAGDAISLGDLGVPGVDVDRGGAYYLAGKKSFSNTAILKVDPEGNFRGDLFWLQSNNPYHQDTSLAGINLEYVDETNGTLGVSYLSVLDVDQGAGLGLWDQRDGMDVVSLRGQGSLGVENLFLSFEYVKESGGDSAVKNEGNAWYVEAGWTFADVAWSPTVNYRYAQFSGDNAATTKNEAFDPLFFGFTRGFGTWFQGEVASNYAGPANSGNDVSRLEISASPRADLQVGAQYWKFTPQDDAPDLAGSEVDLYALWTINDNWVFSPLLGIYMPDGDAVVGAQGNDDRNIYAQAVMMYFF